jgi:hypothetical protein
LQPRKLMAPPLARCRPKTPSNWPVKQFCNQDSPP